MLYYVSFSEHFCSGKFIEHFFTVAAVATSESSAQANYWQQQQTQWAAPVTTHDESPTSSAEPALQQSAPPTPSQMPTQQYAEPINSVNASPQPSYNYWDNHQTEQSEVKGRPCS